MKPLTVRNVRYMQPHKILFLCNKDTQNPRSGGGTRIVFRLMKRLVNNGYSVTLLCGNYPGGKKEEFIDGIKVIRVGGSYSVLIFAMFRYLTSEELRKSELIIDVPLFGIPFFSTFYTRKPVAAIYFHLEKKIFFIELMRKLGKPIGFIAASVAYFIEDRLAPFLYRKCVKLTFSESTKEDMLQTHFGEKILVIQEGIALSAFKSDIDKSKTPMVLYLGRLERYKGIQDALQAMAVVKKSIPNVKLFIVGRGDYEKELRRISKQLNIEENVVFYGYASNAEKIALLHQAHVLVMPSNKEGWATPVIEANACGTPAVASDAKGVKETVQHGVTGFVYPLGEYGKMAEYLTTLITDEHLRLEMSKNAFGWAQKFDWGVSEDRFVVACREILQSNRKRKLISHSSHNPIQE